MLFFVPICRYAIITPVSLTLVALISCTFAFSITSTNDSVYFLTKSAAPFGRYTQQFLALSNLAYTHYPCPLTAVFSRTYIPVRVSALSELMHV